MGLLLYIIYTHGRRERKSTTPSIRPKTIAEEYPFKLAINRDDQQGQWYMRKNVSHCLQHLGHIKVEPTKKS